MWLLAASVGLAWGTVAQGAPPKVESAWNQVKSSVAFLLRDGRPTGPAVLLDASGFFLAHRSAVPASPAIAARMADGTNVVFTLRAIDEHTQLVLLEAAGWTRTQLPQIAVANGADLEGQSVLGVFVSGPALGHCTSVDRVGLIPPTQRYSPLVEIRFEQPQALMGGGLVFTTDGKLVGLLNATLDGLAQPLQTPGPATALTPQAQGHYGPRDLVVGYALGSEVMTRVVQGFRSPERRVRHPVIGALFTSAEEGGALITTVNPGSPAQAAGLRIGDVVVKVGDTPIGNHFDFAKVLFKQRVGSQVSLVVRRAGNTLGLTVRIGST